LIEGSYSSLYILVIYMCVTEPSRNRRQESSGTFGSNILYYLYPCQIRPWSSTFWNLADSLLAFFRFPTWRAGVPLAWERTTTAQGACGPRKSSIQLPAISPSPTLPQSCAFLASFGLGSLHCLTLLLLDMIL